MGFSTILLTITFVVIIGLVCAVTYLAIDNYKAKKIGKGHV